jgi:hypothetical protein
VDGELPDAERRALLLRLDTEPDGWRRCALAFLEAQNWREAFGPLVVPSATAARTWPKLTMDRQGLKSRSLRRVARLTGLAASLLTAFALGWAWHGGPSEIVPRASIAQRETSDPAASQPPPIDLATRDPGLSKPAESIDPVVKQWEQRGYSAETQTRLIPVELKDGRKVAVPVHEVRLRYVGDRIY